MYRVLARTSPSSAITKKPTWRDICLKTIGWPWNWGWGHSR